MLKFLDWFTAVRLSVIGLAALGLGIGLMFYASALGAFLVNDCESFYAPFESFRCAQPAIYSYSGMACLGLSGLSLAAGLWKWVSRLGRNSKL